MRRRDSRYHVEFLERRSCPAVVGILAAESFLREDGRTGSLTVRLSAPDPKPVTVGYFAAGEATIARDYRLSLAGQSLPGSGTLTFKPGETEKVLTITPLDDRLREGAERLSVTLLSVQNATLAAQRTATVTIVDDDDYTAALSGPSRVQPGATATFTLQLSAPASGQETFLVSTVAVSASATGDFRPLTRLPVIFDRGMSSKTFAVSVLPNSPGETDETFQLRAEPGTPDFPVVSPFTVTIAGTGAAALPTVSVAPAAMAEGNSGTSTLFFTVNLSAPSASPVTVFSATADGTATAADQDYQAITVPRPLTFAPGETVKTVGVTVIGDTKAETDEAFSLVLSAPVGATLGSASAVGTIRNDDSATPPPPSGTWTIMVYMTGDNLNTFARDDINEMEWFLSTLPANSGVSIVVSWDQPPASAGQAYATGNGAQAAWRTYGRSVLKGDTTATIASTFDLSLGEKNTGDPATLVDFLKWGAQRAPAANYALQMWGHGGGLDGSQFDSESGGLIGYDALTIAELARALGTSGVPPVRLVSYDNCLMAMAEVGFAVSQQFTGHFVASEELVNGTGQNYVTAYSALASAPAGKTSADIGAGMVASFQEQYAGDPYGCDTFSAVATTGYPQLASAIASFVTATSSLGSGERTTIRNLVLAAPSLSFDEPPFRDLGRFMTRVAAAASLPQPVRTAATAVTAAVSAMVSAKTTDGRDSSGIAIYLPTASDSFLSTYATTATAFCNATGWDRFVRWLATGSRVAGAAATPVATRLSNPPGARGFAALAGGGSPLAWAAYAAAETTDVRGRGRPVIQAHRPG